MPLTSTLLTEYGINQAKLKNIAANSTSTSSTDDNPSSILPFYEVNQAGGLIVNYFQTKGTLCPNINSNKKEFKLQSASRIFLHDLICEGPIFGLFDDLGNDLTLFDNAQNNEENLKGLYLNDYPVKNSVNNTLNYSRVNVFGKVGSEFQSSMSSTIASESDGLFSPYCIGTTYDYNKALYNLNANKILKHLNEGSADPFVGNYYTHNTYLTKKNGSSIENYAKDKINYSVNIDGIFTPSIFEECFGVYHQVKDENTDFLIITLKINTLYTINEGDMDNNYAHFGIQLGFKQNPDFNYYIYHKVYGIASSPYQFDIVLNIKDFNKAAQPFVKIYNLSNAPDIRDTKTQLNLGIGSITEIIDNNFKYPSSAYYTISLDARGFSQLPSRSFNLKLLQIKVPENYDADAKTYNGFWSGEFDAKLRWTDNPAWILYDLVTNYRYGVGKFNVPESLVDKWSIYQIGKYCDELVPTFNNTKYPMLNVAALGLDSRNNWITLNGTDIPSASLQVGGLLCLTNLKFNTTSLTGQTETVIRSYRKRIKSFYFNSNKSSVFVELFNDFGLHKVCSEFAEVRDYVLSKKDAVKTSNQALALILSELINVNSQSLPNFKNYILSQEVFSKDEINEYVKTSGSAAQKFDGYLDIVEPRFTSNLFINSETDIINLINNFASVFRGLIYWSNDYLKLDNDRPKEPSYFFNNSNVKNGVFSYSGSSKDTRYTVVKIVYSDASEGYKDKTVYVEDKLNIKRYGYVEKELLGFGITSRSQAKRIGEWFLVTNQIEQDLITFQAGPEAMLLNPGDIINVSDTLKLSKRYGGRVVDVNDNNEIILDSKYDFIKVNDSISFIVPKKSISVDELNDLTKTQLQTTISDTQISNLSTTYIYTFKVLSVGSEGNFRTKITLKTDESDEALENSYSISPSTLWIYEKSNTNTTTEFFQQYRILGIKESNPVEYDITAVEYVKNKFSYVDNRDNLSANTIYSTESNNQLVTIPRDIVPALLSKQTDTVKIVFGDGLICSSTNNFSYSTKYDYIMSGIDFSDSQISTLFSVNTINVNKILEAILTYSNDLDINPSAVKGLLIEYVLNSKKVSFKWHANSNDQNIYTIAVPSFDKQNTNEFLRIYPLGTNDSFI